MEILVNGKSLDFASDFEIEIQIENPFFSEKGTQSLPITLPYTQRNLYILGYPNRIANYSKRQNFVKAVIRQGIYNKTGRLAIFSIEKNESIECTFYIDDGEFYTIAEKTQLKDIVTTVIAGIGANRVQKVHWLYNLIYSCIAGNNGDWAVFPVITKYDEESQENWEWLNKPVFADTQIPMQLHGYTEGFFNDEIVPDGYGITVFIYINTIIDRIVQRNGYDWAQPEINRPFRSDTDLKRIVVLNSVADAICSGELRYENLMPDCTILEFLSAIEQKFNCRFIVDGQQKKIDIIFFKDIIKKEPQIDITEYVTEEQVIEFQEYKKLIMPANTNNELSEPPTESIKKLKEIYGTPQIGGIPPENGIAFEKQTGIFIKNVGNTSANPRAGMCSFKHDDETLTEITEKEEIAADDEFVPMLKYSYIIDNKQKIMYLPFSGERVHKTTAVKNEKTGTTEKEKSGTNNLKFCFDNGLQTYFRMGSITCFSETGKQIGNLCLFPETNVGIISRYYKEYEEMLANAFQKITIKALLPTDKLLSIDICKPILLQGQKFLIEKLNYRITRNGIFDCDMELLTTKNQAPYTYLNTVWQITPRLSIGWHWVRKDNLDEIIELYGTRGQTVEFKSYRILAKTIFPTIDQYDLPTIEQTDNNFHWYNDTGRVSFVIIGLDGKDRDTYTDVTFNSWLEAVKD